MRLSKANNVMYRGRAIRSRRISHIGDTTGTVKCAALCNAMNGMMRKCERKRERNELKGD